MNFGHRHILFLPPTFQPHQTQALLPILLSHFDNAYAAITNIPRPGAAVVQSPQPNIIYARPEGQISHCNLKLYTSLGDRLFSIQAAHTNPQVVPWNHFFAQHQINARGVHMRQFGTSIFHSRIRIFQALCLSLRITSSTKRMGSALVSLHAYTATLATRFPHPQTHDPPAAHGNGLERCLYKKLRPDGGPLLSAK